MPNVYPFRAVTYASSGAPTELSDVIAPPYDVLDASDKDALLARSAHNVVSIDLPHIPPKDAGPPAVYEEAAKRFDEWLASGVMAQADKPCMFVYQQTFEFEGRTFARTGMACAVETLPFGPRDGGGVLPHEQTFSGPKEDRFALMRAARAQFSPIFGLHHDANGEATKIVRDIAASREPDFVGSFDSGVKHELWRVEDDRAIEAYQSALAGEDVFIADGHHRYTTAINYLAKAEEDGSVGPDHPARRCMIVLVGMSDPGMVIGPTHRVLGGMTAYSLGHFKDATEGVLDLVEAGNDPHALEAAMARSAGQHANVLGLYDFESRLCYVATPVNPDPLAARFPGKAEAWRRLDVAVIQHLIVEGVCEPKLNDGQPVQWAFPHSIDEVLEIGAGAEKGSGGGKSFTPQLAVIVRPTPLDAVREVSAAGELMPQKSTFFYPKLATGLFINRLAD